MDILLSIVDLVLHLDKHLSALLQQYGPWIYLLLFLIVFCETGLVIAPFLPGDSLLFVAGALWAAAAMDVHALMATLICAALLGDNCNYWVGRYLGPKVFRWEGSRLFNRKALDYTHAFYDRHGGKTIIMARFLPLVRTFAPFVAGVGRMRYARFIGFSVFGAILWVVSLVYAGYFLGNIPVVRNNLTVVILAIIAISLAPLIVEMLRARMRRAQASD
jgi:membrane-associated protein